MATIKFSGCCGRRDMKRDEFVGALKEHKTLEKIRLEICEYDPVVDFGRNYPQKIWGEILSAVTSKLLYLLPSGLAGYLTHPILIRVVILCLGVMWENALQNFKWRWKVFYYVMW